MKLSNVEDIYPLAPLQQGILFHSLYESTPQTYFIQLGCCIEGDLDPQAFREAWREVIRRHSILRTEFIWEGLEEPLQVVRQQVELPWTEEDWRDQARAIQDEKWRQLLKADQRRGFDLKRAPLLRFTLIQAADNRYLFAWSHHHILLDGWCQHVILREVFAIYEAHRNRQQANLPLPRPYSEYIAWLKKQDESKAKAFWSEELKGFQTPTRWGIELDSAEFTKGEPKYESISIQLGQELAGRLQEFTRLHHLTPNAVVQGAWGLLLNRYSGEQAGVFGATVSGRSPDIKGIESILGLFINTLPVRVDIQPEETVKSYLTHLQVRQAEAREFDYTPLVKAQEWSGAPRGSKLFEHIFVFENYPIDTSTSKRVGSKLQISDITTFESSNYPLALAINAGLSCTFTYDSRYYRATDLERLAQHLRTLLEQMCAAPLRTVGELSLLSEAERQQVAVAWNQTDAQYVPRRVHQLFEEQARQTPDLTALEDERQRLTYRELNRQANRLAHYLKTSGVNAQRPVGICVERSVKMVVGILGILKAGAAYLPLDPGYPHERLAYMVQDADPVLVITEERLQKAFSLDKARLLYLDTEWEAIAHQQSDEDLQTDSDEQDLAYVIYTSGSTGRPKGVAITHKGFQNYVNWARTAYGFEAGGRTPLCSSLSFDLSITSLWPPLVSGGCVVLTPEKAGIEWLVNGNRAPGTYELLKITPAHLQVLREICGSRTTAVSRKFIVGGEALQWEELQPWRQQVPPVYMVNEYGPTETVVGSSVYTSNQGWKEYGPVPIGRPIANTRLYVVDPWGGLAGVGAKGELYIGGDGVARGYLNQPALTAERFVPDAFSGKQGTRLYRTGDLVRWNADGYLEYLGRMDEQVKRRGFRIELAEIETVLAGYEGVTQAKVIVREDQPGDKRVVAYAVGQNQYGSLNIEELRNHVKQHLPPYMVPDNFVELEKLPLTSNGKVDREALPKPEGTEAPVDLLPRDEVELKLAGIWEELLGISQIGRRQNFFDLGGHSVLVISLMGRIKQQFGQEIPLAALVEGPTIEHLAGILRQKYRSTLQSNLVPIQRQGTKPPLFFAHPGGGKPFCYIPLAYILGLDQPFYGLQALDEQEMPQEPFLSMEHRAALYLKAIREVQPRGPYILGGWSFGAYVAFEMAQQLIAQNEEVAELLLLDVPSKPDICLPPKFQDDATYLVHIFDYLRLHNLLPKAHELPEVSLNDDWVGKSRERMQYVMDQLIKVQALPPEANISDLRIFLHATRKRMLSLAEYTLLPYSGPITLIRARDIDSADRENVSDDMTLGFGKLCAEKVRVYFAPGTHHNMVFPPHVQGLAEILKKCIYDPRFEAAAV